MPQNAISKAEPRSLAMPARVRIAPIHHIVFPFLSFQLVQYAKVVSCDQSLKNFILYRRVGTGAIADMRLMRPMNCKGDRDEMTRKPMSSGFCVNLVVRLATLFSLGFEFS